MGFFEPKITIYKKKDRGTWEQILRVLKENGIKGVKSGHYFQDAVSPNGCGGMLDPRNFGTKGKIDRDIYFIEVKESVKDDALNAIHNAGIQTTVDEDAAVDAATKKNEEEAAGSGSF